MQRDMTRRSYLVPTTFVIPVKPVLSKVEGIGIHNHVISKSRVPW